MSNYTVTTDFGAKDALAAGNSGKKVRGSEFTTEFTNIATAVATKADAASAALTGTSTVNSIEIGFRKIPAVASTGETIAATAVGKCYDTTGNMTIPANVFVAGDAVSIYNNSSGNLTITQGASLTLRQVGTANTGNRTLAQRGFVTVWFRSATEAVISGGGLS